MLYDNTTYQNVTGNGKSVAANENNRLALVGRVFRFFGTVTTEEQGFMLFPERYYMPCYTVID